MNFRMTRVILLCLSCLIISNSYATPIYLDFDHGLGVNSDATQEMCGITYTPQSNSVVAKLDGQIYSARGCVEVGPMLAKPFDFETEAGNMYNMRRFQGSVCELGSEKSRMLNALWVLKNASKYEYSQQNTFNNSGILLWAYQWASNQAHILENTCHESTHFQKVRSGFPHFRNTYYMRFNGDWLFNGDVISRASVVVHEARHRDVGHISDSACPRGGSCDAWNAQGANEYQRVWLQWFAVDSSPLFTPDARNRARDYANAIASNAFDRPRPLLTLDSSSNLEKNSRTARGIETPRLASNAQACPIINIQPCNEGSCGERFGRECHSRGGVTSGFYVCRERC